MSLNYATVEDPSFVFFPVNLQWRSQEPVSAAGLHERSVLVPPATRPPPTETSSASLQVCNTPAQHLSANFIELSYLRTGLYHL